MNSKINNKFHKIWGRNKKNINNKNNRKDLTKIINKVT